MILNYNFFVNDFGITLLPKTTISILVEIYNKKDKKNLCDIDIFENKVLGYIENKSIYLKDCIKVFLNKKEKNYNIFIDKELLKKLNYELEYKILEYSTFYEEINGYKTISEKEFLEEISKNYYYSKEKQEINFTKITC